MARPKKDGLDYFPFDIDFFDDEKIGAISGEFGIKGEIIAIRLLCAVYRNGYFAVWTDTLKMKMLKAAPGISPELLEQIVNRLVRWGFFDKTLFDSVRVLTSAGIQKRYFDIIKRRQSDSKELPYLLVEFDGRRALRKVNVDNNSVNVDNNPQIVDENPLKEKERKEKEFELLMLRTHEQNVEFFNIFFSGRTDLTPILMQLHGENPSTKTIDDFKELAKLVIYEWELSKSLPHADYSQWSKHLLNHVRIKNRVTKPKQQNETKTKYDPRRGVDPTAEEHQDWDSTF